MSDDTARLTRLAALAEQLGADDAAGDARALAARVAEGRFFLVTVGQFKRGKSTLLNALLGEAVLPTGVAPVTSAITVVRDIVPRRIRTWLAEVEPQAETLYRRAAGRFVTLANEFLSSLASSGDRSFEHLPRSLDPDAGFREPRRFYFTDLMHLTAVNPATWILDQIRGPSAAVNAISQDATRYAERLLTSNSSRVIFDLRERLSESRRGLEADLRLMLKETGASATRALALARRLRDEGEPVIAREVWRLEQHRVMLHALAGEDAPGGSRDA